MSDYGVRDAACPISTRGERDVRPGNTKTRRHLEEGVLERAKEPGERGRTHAGAKRRDRALDAGEHRLVDTPPVSVQ